MIIALADQVSGSPSYNSNSTPSSTSSFVHKLLDDAAASTRLQPVVSSLMGQYPELAQQQSLPPMAPVLKVLRIATDVPQRFFLEFPNLSVKDFTEK